MSLSRWKIMAGMFGLSVAGIYAVAGPATKTKTEVKGSPVSSGAVTFVEPPLVMPVTGVLPVTQASGVIPQAPAAELVVPAAGRSEAPVTLPEPPAILPVVSLPEPVETPPVSLPSLPPLVVSADPPMLLVMTPPAMIILPPPATIQTVKDDMVITSIPSSITLPKTMPVPTCPTVPVEYKLPPLPTYEVSVPAPMFVVSPSAPPMLPPANEMLRTEGVRFPNPIPETKFRIVLRVGDGEPVFEVRSGDNIVMKVISEKVDVKSPMEKGQSLSTVKALGKVRFVGFGAEGFCDELSFMAGTGEVSLTGSVRVHVKDKLGRVESELSGEKMNYRLDTTNSSLAGGLEP